MITYSITSSGVEEVGPGEIEYRMLQMPKSKIKQAEVWYNGELDTLAVVYSVFSGEKEILHRVGFLVDGGPCNEHMSIYGIEAYVQLKRQCIRLGEL